MTHPADVTREATVKILFTESKARDLKKSEKMDKNYTPKCFKWKAINRLRCLLKGSRTVNLNDKTVGILDQIL